MSCDEPIFTGNHPHSGPFCSYCLFYLKFVVHLQRLVEKHIEAEELAGHCEDLPRERQMVLIAYAMAHVGQALVRAAREHDQEENKEES